MELPKLWCKRCGAEWYPRRPEPPKVCPRCNSPYWNRERRKISIIEVEDEEEGEEE